MKAFRYISKARLGVSEPSPFGFDNPANAPEKGWNNGNWLRSLFHFSFAEYHNSANRNFGVLRVMNDDLVQPQRGFGEHPHSNMEICTFIVSGDLTHGDSMGSRETLGRGAVQFMTAGSGIYHSERNESATTPLRFIQIWINPRAIGLKPKYGSALGSFEDRHNRFAHLVADAASTYTAPIKINQDANIFVCELDANASAPFTVGKDRQAYLINIEGETAVQHAEGQTQLSAHDAAEITGDNSLTFTAKGTTPSLVLLVEMAHVEGSGRKDL